MDKMTTFWLNYSTSNNTFPIEIKVKLINKDDVVYDPEYIRGLCKNGCKNYNYAGGCPPRAPLFEELNKDMQSYFLVSGTFWPQYKTEKVKASHNIYIHFRLQDNILARLFHNAGISIRQKTACVFLATGYCMGCTGVKCNYKLGNEYCKNPQKRTYSMEATGINVEQTLFNNLNIKLQWYRNNKELDLPITKVCLFMFQEYSLDKFIELFQSC